MDEANRAWVLGAGFWVGHMAWRRCPVPAAHLLVTTLGPVLALARPVTIEDCAAFFAPAQRAQRALGLARRAFHSAAPRRFLRPRFLPRGSRRGPVLGSAGAALALGAATCSMLVSTLIQHRAHPHRRARLRQHAWWQGYLLCLSDTETRGGLALTSNGMPITNTPAALTSAAIVGMRRGMSTFGQFSNGRDRSL